MGIAGQSQSLVKSVVPQVVQSIVAHNLSTQQADAKRAAERAGWAGKPIPENVKKYLPPGLGDMGDVYDLFGSGDAYQRYVGDLMRLEGQGMTREYQQKQLYLKEYNDMLFAVQEKGMSPEEWEAMGPNEQTLARYNNRFVVTPEVRAQLDFMASRLGIKPPPIFGITPEEITTQDEIMAVPEEPTSGMDIWKFLLNEVSPGMYDGRPPNPLLSREDLAGLAIPAGFGAGAGYLGNFAPALGGTIMGSRAGYNVGDWLRGLVK